MTDSGNVRYVVWSTK